MATQTFTVGRDFSAILIGPNGNKFDLSTGTTIEWTPEYKTVRSDPISVPPMERFLPAGHRLVYTVDRNGPANDRAFAAIENGWWATGTADGGTNNSGTAYLYVTEADGSQTVYAFQGVAIKLAAGGSIMQDSPIKQRIETFAQTGGAR